VVLYYHAIKPYQRARFARQMDELSKRAHVFPAGSPEVMLRDRQNVAVTFDDGFRSVIENAVPELLKRSIPFTVFVPSGCLGARPAWVRNPQHPSFGEQVLTASELRELARAPLVTLGSHSITHRNLVGLDAPSATHELERSKAELGPLQGQ
jgi:peptidoglycan/xylan/chitin deacetylase (PgdA/CDA1 family)